MKYVVFDSYDNKRENPIEIEHKKVLKKGEEFEFDIVSYRVNKVFRKKKYKHKCLEIKMLRYRIADTATSFVHKCQARKGAMEKMNTEQLKKLKAKFGEKNVSGWVKDGRSKMHGMKVANKCCECGTVFYKKNVKIPEEVSIVAVAGRKKLVRRK